MVETEPEWLGAAADDCATVGHDWVPMFNSNQELVLDWEACQRCHEKRFTGDDGPGPRS